MLQLCVCFGFRINSPDSDPNTDPIIRKSRIWIRPYLKPGVGFRSDLKDIEIIAMNNSYNIFIFLWQSRI